MPDITQDQPRANYREINGDILPKFYENQVAMVGHLADLGYPFHRFIEEERARGAAANLSGFTPEDFAPAALRAVAVDGGKFNRTGLMAVPTIPRLPLVFLAQLVMQLDASRKSARSYKAGRAEFVAEVMRAFSYSVTLAVLKNVNNGPVRTAPISPLEQLDARHQIARLDTANDRFQAQLIEANEPLVWKCARSLMSNGRSDPSEVLNLGRLGLLFAIHKWEPGHHGSSTDDAATLGGVAAGWIQHSIRRTQQNTAHVVAKPIQVQALLARALKVRDQIPNATPEQIAIELCLATRTAKSARLAAEVALDREGVIARLENDSAWLREVAKQTVHVQEALASPITVPLEKDSDDGAFGNTADCGYSNSLEASVSEVARNAVDSSEEAQVVDNVLKKLSPLSETVVRLTFGLPGSKECIREQFRAMRRKSESATMAILADRGNRPPAALQILDAIVMSE
jgi:DNA-directed RNA polymerase sigma subunit (sigma70/sigma32)